MRYLLLPLLLLLLPGAAAAQVGSGGVVGIYADESAYCLLFDTPGAKTLHVIHKFTTGATGSKFRIEFSAGFTGNVLSFSAPAGSVSGDPLTGLTVAYGGCLAGNIEILQVTVMMYGTSSECSWVRTMPLPSSSDGKIDTYNCISTRLPAEWAGTHVQHHAFPPFCFDLAGISDAGQYGCRPADQPLSIEASTWGAVKALYR